MNRETVRQLLLLFLNMFKDMGYESMTKTNSAGTEVGMAMGLLIAQLERGESGANEFLDELMRRYTGDESIVALEELSVAIRKAGGDEVLGDPEVASALRQAEALLGIKVSR
jgi:hypothetical protein